MKIHKRAVVYNTFFLVMSSILLQLMGFGYRIFMSRLIGPEGMGVYQLVMPAYSVIMSLTLSGFTIATTELCSKFHAIGDYKNITRVVSTCVVLFIGMFAVTAAVVLPSSGFIAEHLLGEARTKWGLVLLIPCLFLTGFENILKSAFHGLKNVFPPIISELMEQGVRITAVLSLLYFCKPKNAGMAAALIILGMIISEVISSSTMALFYKRQKKHFPASLPVQVHTKSGGGLKRSVMRIAFPVAFAGLLNNLLATANTVLIPVRLRSAAVGADDALATFGVMTGMTVPLLMLPSAFIMPICTVLLPRLSEALALRNMREIKRKTAKSIHVTGLVAMPVLGVMMALGSQIGKMVYSIDSAADYIAPLALGALFMFYHVVTGNILNGIERQGEASFSVIFTGLLELGFTYFLVGNPRFGIKGYVIGFIISSLAGCLINFFYVVKHTQIQIRWRNWFIKPLLGAAAATCSAKLGFGFLCGYMTQGVAMIAALIGGAAVYLAALRFQGMSLGHYLGTILVKEKKNCYLPESAPQKQLRG